MANPIQSFGGIGIYVNGDNGRPQPKISEHFVLDGTESVFHYFGHGSDGRTLSCTIMDNPTALENLKTMCKTLASGLLVSDQGNEGAWILESIEYTRIVDISRTTPVWKATLNLKEA